MLVSIVLTIRKSMTKTLVLVGVRDYLSEVFQTLHDYNLLFYWILQSQF